MSLTIPTFAHAFQFNGLNTYNYTIMTAGQHLGMVRCVSQNGPAGISITVKQNGTTIATSPSQNSGAAQVEVSCPISVNCAVSDAISIIVASSNSADSAPNQVLGSILLYPSP